MISAARRLLLGSPIPTTRMEHERVGPLGGLALFAPDAMSSVAYGPEEVLIVLVAAGAAGLGFAIPIGIALTILVAIVAASYRQTVLEYPSGGGAYVVARENLGVRPAQVAGAALLTDYILTVAVQTAAGVAAVTSALPELLPYHVPLCIVCVLGIMFINLRGVRESAAAFALPVYGFIGCVIFVILVGMWRLVTGTLEPRPIPEGALAATEGLTAFLVLRAFSSGCASLTGIEAVANGVQALREPRGRNGANVMLIMASVLGFAVCGISILAHRLNAVPLADQTVMSQIGEGLFGRTAFYYILQTTTALILILGANTSFAGFPQLAAFMAKDGYMPRQMTNLGDRLVYANGIVILAGLAILLIVAFNGVVTRLIPLYAIGVFTAFTLSQTGMVVHSLRKGDRASRMRAVVNGIGALCTGVVVVVIAVTKFTHGAWIVCLVIPGMVCMFAAVSRHYRWVAEHLTLEGAQPKPVVRNLNILLVGGMNRGTLSGLQYLKSLGGESRCLHVEIEGHENPRVLRLWREWEKDLELTVLQSPYRSYAEPLVDYIRKAQREEGFGFVTVVLPEFVVNSVWEGLLHNHTATWLQIVLRSMPGVAVTNMRYRLQDQ
jgi:amino acid transporter